MVLFMWLSVAGLEIIDGGVEPGFWGQWGPEQSPGRGLGQSPQKLITYFENNSQVYVVSLWTKYRT